jgi:hypothetical protein
MNNVMPVRSKLLLATTLMATLLAAPASLTAQELTMRCDPPAGSLGRLSQTQKEAFMKSQDMFIAGHYADALEELRGLLAQIPPNTPAHSAMAERTAEAAIEAGERAYAISLLKPIEEHDGNDCLARTLLARADAEDGQAAARDAEISALTALHKKAPKSVAGKLDGFLLEKHILKNGGKVEIWYVLQPFGPHHTYIVSDITDPSGDVSLHIELDSDDPDQIYFKEIHPELVAKGDRRFSLDAFASNKLEPDSKVDHHALIQFFDGAPNYDAVRERILAIAERSAKPLS